MTGFVLIIKISVPKLNLFPTKLKKDFNSLKDLVVLVELLDINLMLTIWSNSTKTTTLVETISMPTKISFDQDKKINKLIRLKFK